MNGCHERSIDDRRAPAGDRSGAERGATLVEYALLLALFGVGLVGSLDYLRDVAVDTVGAAGEQVGRVESPLPPGDSSPPPSGPTTPTTVTPTTVTPTTVTPTTVTPTTVTPTTVTPTTAPTIDQPGNPSSGSRWDDDEIDRTNDASGWTVTAPLAVTNNGGQPVNEKAQAHVRVERLEGGEWTEVSILEVDAGSDVSVDGLDIGWDRVRLTLVDVTGSGSKAWDGQQASIVVDRP